MNKKTILTIAAVAIISLMGTQTASAHRYSPSKDGHWFRLIAYPVNALGLSLEHVIFRPIHKFVSQPNNDIIFGHKSRIGEDDTYHEFIHGDYSPSIKAELAEYRELQRRSSDN